MPDDVAIEKVQVLEKLGAKVERVRPGEWRRGRGRGRGRGTERWVRARARNPTQADRF
jgi:hypothetical protein